MKKILITQRVDKISSYNERRDALDQRWVSLMLDAGLMPVPVANNMVLIDQMLSEEQFDGLLLSGGNTLSAYGGDCPERDQVESFLLAWAQKQALPVLGVCRGMQLMQHQYQIPLVAVTGHIAVRVPLHVVASDQISHYYSELGAVSLYHQYGTRHDRHPLQVVAKTADDVVMAIRHQTLPLFGIMWHPERETAARGVHVQYLKAIFEGGK